jgi:UDPglucose--hexose-1-phosphate uridylyltransferase
MDFIATEHPHRRFNPLKGEWVLVSPHRTKRPWQGQQEKGIGGRPSYDPTCLLCPGNKRASGDHNPAYTGTFVFDNDFAALLPEAPDTPASPGEGSPEAVLFRQQPVAGNCRVICFHPRHDLTLPEMEPSEIEGVIRTWERQTSELGAKYAWVQVFENKGAVMGCSNPHPHGQIWAGDFIPNEIAAEDANQRAYFTRHGRPLLLDYAGFEAGRGERIVAENKSWIAVVPFWAVWPYEILLLPRGPMSRLTDLNDTLRADLAMVMKELLTRYDNLFETSFPYSMGWHGAPFTGGPQDHWQLHAHFYPPLLRSASVKKFMVGYEMLGEAQRDLTAEQAAANLRATSPVHYKSR